MRAANVIATFIKSTAIKYNTWFFQFLLNNPGEKRRFAIHQALQSVRDIPFDSAPYCFHSHSFFHNYHKNPCDPSFYVFFKRWVTYCLPRNVPLRKRRSQRKTRAREKPAGYEINEINSKMFVTSIFLLYSYIYIRSFFIQSFIIHSFNLLLLLFSLISFDSLRFNYQNLRESRRVDEGRIVGESFEDYNIHRWRAGKKGKVGKEKRVEEWKAKKICAAKEISGTNRGGAMRATLFLRLIALSFSPSFSSSGFSQAHVHPATHTQTREEDTRKRSHTTVRSSSLSLSFFHPAHCSQEPCTALCL